MMKWLLKIGLKFVSYQTLVDVIASALAYILEYARKSATPKAWANAKDAVRQIRNWTTLLDEVYEDDTLTEEEEKLIEQAISNCTMVDSIYKLLKNKKAPKKVGATKKTSSTKKTITAKRGKDKK